MKRHWYGINVFMLHTPIFFSSTTFWILERCLHSFTLLSISAHFHLDVSIFSYAFSCNPTARLDSSFRTLKLYYKSIIADISNRLYHFIREFLPRNLLQRIGINNAEMYIREFCNWLNFNRNFIENHCIFQASIWILISNCEFLWIQVT